jgi:spore coat protein U-like protein
MKLTKLLLVLASFGALVIGASAPAFADQVTPNLGVTATVKKTCVITTNTVAFGDYDFTVGKDAVGAIVFNCSKGTGPNIKLGLGGNVSGTQRRMTSGGNFLNYTLYTDSGRTTEWLSTASISGVDVGSVPVYGRIPINQNAPIGDYADTVVATVDF